MRSDLLAARSLRLRQLTDHPPGGVEKLDYGRAISRDLDQYPGMSLLVLQA